MSKLSFLLFLLISISLSLTLGVRPAYAYVILSDDKCDVTDNCCSIITLSNITLSPADISTSNTFNAIKTADLKVEKGNIRFDSVTFLKSNQIKVCGRIYDQENYWGIGTIWNSTWWNMACTKRINITIVNPSFYQLNNNYLFYVNVSTRYVPNIIDFQKIHFIDIATNTEMTIWNETNGTNYGMYYINGTTVPYSGSINISMYYNGSSCPAFTNSTKGFDKYIEMDTLTGWTTASGSPLVVGNSTSCKSGVCININSANIRRDDIGPYDQNTDYFLEFEHYLDGSVSGGSYYERPVAGTELTELHPYFGSGNWGYWDGADKDTSVLSTKKTITKVSIVHNRTNNTYDVYENYTNNTVKRGISEQNNAQTIGRLGLTVTGLAYVDRIRTRTFVSPQPYFVWGDNETLATPVLHLAFNGTEGNRTYDCGELINISVWFSGGDFSELYAAMYMNNSFMSNVTTPYVQISSFDANASAINYTAYFTGDGVYSPQTVTWYFDIVNCSAPPIPPTNTTGSLYRYCNDSFLLTQNYYNQYTGNYVNLSEYCEYGCDDMLDICKPSSFILVIILIGAFVVFLFIIGWIKRNWLR